MNKKDIIKRLTNTQLDTHERESLTQLLHYLHAEGITHTSNNNTRSNIRTSSNYKGKKHTSSKNTR